MSLIDKIRDAFGGGKAQSNEGGKIIPTGYEAYGLGSTYGAVNKTKEYLNQLKGWVASAVTAISDEVGSIQLHLYKYAKDGSVEEITEHPILDLLFKVNSFTTKLDHFWLTQTYLELTGEAPWFLDRGKGNEIENIFLLRPDRIRPIAGKSRMIEGYEYEIGVGEKIKLSTKEVLFLKNPNPSKPFRGMGTLQMADRVVDIDNFSEEWNKKFYENSARPDAILSVNSERLDNEQKDRLKKSLEKTYSGNQNAHKVMVLYGDMKFEKSGFSMKDMDFLEQQRFSRDKILGIFRVPKAIVAQTEGVNFASAKVSQYVFARFTIKPKMERIIQQLNEFLLPMYPNTENMFLDYKSPVPEDEEGQLKKYDNGLKNGWLTINEVRQEQGLPDVDGGDVIYISNSFGELGANGGTEPVKMLKVKEKKPTFQFSNDRIFEMKARGKKFFKAQKQEIKVKEEIRKTLKEGLTKAKKEKKIKTKKEVAHTRKVITKAIEKETEVRRKFTSEEEYVFWAVKNAIFDKYRKKITKAMQDVFIQQRKKTIAKLNRKKGVHYKSTKDLSNDILLDEKKEIELTMKITIPILTDLFKESGNETFALLDVEQDMDVTRGEVAKLINSQARMFSKTTTETTNQFIKKQITEGLAKGEDILQLRERIKGVFDGAVEYRAERIARTESLKYNTRASEQAFKDSEIVEGKKWVNDPNPCEFCQSLAGKTAPLGSNFIKKGDTVSGRVFDYEDIPSPPVHPNCYDSLTEIYTEQGFRFIKDVNKNDLVMTLNPKTKNLIWEKVSNTVEYEVDSIYSLTNKQKSFDMKVSKNHPFFGYKRINKGKKGRFLEPITVEGIDKLNSEFKFYNSSEWKGNKVDCKLGNYPVDEELFAKFMGWYLSEGSVTKRGNKWYQISIAQTKYKDELIEDLNNLPFKISINKQGITINDTSLGKQLSVYGKSFEKFIPDEIKNMKPEYIKIFLNRYCLGDGNIKEGKKFKGYNFGNSVSYFTSSKKMADDLGELIIKTRKSVSYNQRKPKLVKHKNGLYKGNHIIWVVNELIGNYKTFTNIKVKKINKKQTVYDVEVPKNHTILIRRKGKVVWGSNCQCDIVPIFKKVSN